MSYLEFCAVDNSPLSFTLGQAFHHLAKLPFTWFAQVKAQVQAIAHVSCQGLTNTIVRWK